MSMIVMDDQHVAIDGKQTVLTYAFLYEAACLALEQATDSEEGSFYNRLCSIMMNACCLEAYLNHIGMQYFEDWDERESPLDKLERVMKEKGIKIDYSKRPFQSMKAVNKFRNELAHGRTINISISRTSKTPARSKLKYPKTRWQQLCDDKDKAAYFLTDLEKIIKMIHKSYGAQGTPLGMLTLGTYSETIKKTNR